MPLSSFVAQIHYFTSSFRTIKHSMTAESLYHNAWHIKGKHSKVPKHKRLYIYVDTYIWETGIWIATLAPFTSVTWKNGLISLSLVFLFLKVRYENNAHLKELLSWLNQTSKCHRCSITLRSLVTHVASIHILPPWFHLMPGILQLLKNVTFK